LTWLRSSLLFGFEDLLVIEVAIAKTSTEDFDGHNLLFKDVQGELAERNGGGSWQIPCLGLENEFLVRAVNFDSWISPTESIEINTLWGCGSNKTP